MIPGYFDQTKIPAVPKLRVRLFVPGITTQWVFIDFLVDTGASNTSIHPLDALTRLHIEPQVLMEERHWTPPNPTRASAAAGSSTFGCRPPMPYKRRRVSGSNSRVTSASRSSGCSIKRSSRSLVGTFWSATNCSWITRRGAWSCTIEHRDQQRR
jgi:hypothetical protein